jgi:glycosyltransferase involved in cell wall biosynthesis
LIWLNKRHFDLVYFTQFNHPILYRKPYIITVHDLTTFGYFHYENPVKVAMFRRVMKSAVNDSKKIVAVSNTTKDEILNNYSIDEKKIEVIYLGVDRNYLRISRMAADDRYKLGKKFAANYELPGKYLLYTGMWKKHKNLLRLLEAFEKFRSRAEGENRELQLVLVGKIDRNQPEVVEEIEQINGHLIDVVSCADPVFVAGFVPEELLPSAYAGALAYVQPSLNEGFGLPPLEAMACGAPVIASNVSATPEILGDAAEYFEPESVEDIADKIDKIVNDPKLRINLQRRGLERVKLYTWEKNAEKTLKVIQGELRARSKK